MKKLGKIQTLEVLRFTSVGAYINAIDETSDSDVLLPKKYLSDDIALGDMVDVFLYKDAQNRLIATTQKPFLEVGDIGVLQVDSVSQHGAFLKWGLDKDLFMPFDEQKQKVQAGQKVTVIVYIDNSERLSASEKIERHLTTQHNYSNNEWVEGTVYKFHPDIGAFVAVNNRHFGLVPLKDCLVNLTAGQQVKARIAKIHPDGKLVLALRAAGSEQLFRDVEVIKERLMAQNGKLPFDDKATPVVIKQQLNMSKKAFKRAVGVLLKEGIIKIEENAIVKVDS